MSDPYYDQVAVLIPCVDDLLDAKGNTITVANSGALSGTQFKYGSQSFLAGTLKFDSQVLVDAGVGVGDFCFEFWYYPDGTAVSSDRLLQTRDGDVVPGMYIAHTGAFVIQFGLDLDGTGGFDYTSPSIAIPSTQWNHICVERVGNVVTLYINGASEAVTAASFGGDLAISGSHDTVIGGQTVGSTRVCGGWFQDIRITAESRYAGAFTPPGRFPEIGGIDAIGAIPSLLGVPAAVLEELDDRRIQAALPTLLGAPAAVVKGTMAVRGQIPSPLGAPTSYVQNDFTGLLTDDSPNYVVRLTGSPDLEVPVSSWQATVQTDRQDYVQAVVPGAQDLLTAISDRVGSAQMVVYRVGKIGEMSVETEMARASLDTARVNGGSVRTTVTLSGYQTNAASEPTVERTLTGIRQTTQTVNGDSRVRSDIDWLLRPGQTVQAGLLSFTANYINYYVPARGDAYMDVGSRGQG